MIRFQNSRYLITLLVLMGLAIAAVILAFKPILAPHLPWLYLLG